MDLWTFFIDLPEFFNKYSRRWYSFVLPIVISVTLFGSLYGKVVFTFNDIKLDLSIILSILIFVIWSFIFYFSRRKLKNTSDLPGIGIFLGDSVSGPNNVGRKRFIRDIKRIFYKKFEVRVYDENDYKKYIDCLILKSKVFVDKNLFCAIILNDDEGLENGEEVYVLNVNIGFYSRNVFGFDFDKYRNNFSFDLDNVLPTSFKIYKNNNIKESLDISKRIYASVNYLYAINLIVSKTPEVALDYINNVESVIDDLDQSSYSVIYMKENLLVRKFEVKINSLDIFLSTNYDFYDDESNQFCLDSINDILIDVNKLMERGYENIENVYKNLLIEKVKTLFDLGFYDNAIEIIDKEELLLTHKEYAFIIKLLCMSYSVNYSNEQVFSYFKKSRKKFNGKQKEFMLKFVQKRYEYYENDYNLIFIFFLLNKYFKDKTLAKKLYEDLLNDKNKKYYDIFKRFDI